MKGFTLIELLIVVGILSGILFGAFYAFTQFRQTQLLNTATETVRNMLVDARVRSTASVGGVAYGVRIDTTHATLFPSPYSSGSPSNTVYIFPSPVTATASVSEILFQRITGATTSHGTITVLLPNGETNIITIFPTGVIQ